jgi:hypothetical protein
MDFLYHDFNVTESFGETVSAKYTIGASLKFGKRNVIGLTYGLGFNFIVEVD